MRTLRRFLILLLVATIALTATAYGSEGDQDNDGVIDSQDNCPAHHNPDQADRQLNGKGDACDDPDMDGLSDQYELYATYGGGPSPRRTNPDNAHSDGDGRDDGYEVNRTYANGRKTDPTLTDTDADGWEDGTEIYAGTDPTNPDSDNDGHRDSIDNCAKVYNPDQKNTYGGPRGDACEPYTAPPCPTLDPCQGQKLAKQVEDAVAPVIEGAAAEAERRVNEAIEQLPRPDVRPVANHLKMGSDGHVVKVIQHGGDYFTVQVLNAVTGVPVQLDLAMSPLYTVNGPVAVMAYTADDTPTEPTRVNVKWRYSTRNKTLTIRVLRKQTFSNVPVTFAAPVIGYPADCNPQFSGVVGTSHCDGYAVGYYNAGKLYRALDALDAVPYPITVSAV